MRIIGSIDETIIDSMAEVWQCCEYRFNSFYHFWLMLNRMIELKRSALVLTFVHIFLYFFLLLFQQKLFILWALIKLIMFDLDMLKKRAIWSITFTTTRNGAIKVPFNLISSSPMSFSLLLLALTHSEKYLHVFKFFRKLTFFPIDNVNLIVHYVMLANQS